MQKLISNREVFRQLLVRDIVAIIEDLNAGTWCDLVTIKNKLHNALADRQTVCVYRQVLNRRQV